MADGQTPVSEAEQKMINDWLDWVAGHSEPAGDMTDAHAIAAHLTGLVQQPFISEYGPEELFALGIAWGESLRLRNPTWSWVVVPAEDGPTVALSVPTGITGDRILTPGHLYAKRAGQPPATLDPAAMDQLLASELGGTA